ncbi:hypothetical protein HPB52_018146 [Rhipicephalus sanguineus]|uniref:Retrotransposon gag domain-containing protein n=1 Tax=Rhipicephalus sanguineus TaxID=34632 RepID=A0A9D4SXC4_RHISA|nr:hypothetical protein HPB52_018146 [Rhipicephalus sanguineus]
MAFAGIAPTDPFLPTTCRPVQPWSRWHDMFKVYLLASGASEFSPERRKAAEKTEEEEGTGATADVYDSAVAALAKNFDTTCNLVVERHRFHRRTQFPGESIQEYATALTELAAMCSFTSQEESLRDHFDAGPKPHPGLRTHLVAHPYLTQHSAISRPPLMCC